MRPSSLFLAAPVAAFVALTASAARADGAFLTLKDSSGVVGRRVPLASFSADTQASSGGASTGAGAGRVGSSTATFEIDGADNAAAYFGMVTTARTGTATVEFTTPDAQGREQVSTVATFSLASLKTASLTLDANGFGAAYSIEYGRVEFGTPGTAGSPATQAPVLPGPARLLGGRIPSIRRVSPRHAMLPVAGSPAEPSIDTAFLALTGPTGSLARSPLKTATLSVAANAGQATGAGAGRTSLTPFSVTQARPGTPEIQQAVARGTLFERGTLSFAHAGSDILVLDLRQVVAKDDQVALVAGALTESSSFSCRALEISDTVTHVHAQ